MGATLSDDDIERLEGLDQYVRARDKAMRMLAVRPRSRREIDYALRRPGISDAIRKGMVDELEESGWIND